MADKFSEGVALFEKGAFEEAAALFAACGPNNAEALCLKGASFAKLSRLEEAEAAYKSAIQIAPSAELIHASYAAFLASQKRSEDAERAGRAAEEAAIRSGSPERVIGAARALARAEIWSAAASAYKAAINSTSITEVDACQGAIVHFRAGDHAAALQILDAIHAAGAGGMRTFETGAVILEQMGEWARLERVASEWSTAFPNAIEALNRRAQALFELGRYPEAVSVYERAVELDSNNPSVHANLGRLYMAARELEAAQRSFETALEKNPDIADAHFGLARIATHQGDLKKAEASVRRALKSNPAFIPAYAELAAITEGAMTDADMAQLEGLASDEALAKPLKATILFTLGDGFHFRREYSRAAEAYRSANDILAKAASVEGHAYNHDAEEQRFETIKQRSLKEQPLVNIDAQSADTPLTPIFVVGMPRSGTTLMEGVLAAHRDVFAAGEMIQMPALVDEYLTRAPSAQESDEWRSWLDAARAKYLAEARGVNADDGPFFVDKQPLNFNAVGLIKQMFPASPIIYIRRSPLETCFSIYRRNFSKFWPFANDLSDLGRQYSLHARYMVHWQSLYADDVLFVQYSDVIENFESEARRIIDFCGLDWDPNCLSPQKAKRSVATFSRAQVRKPVTKNYSGQYEPYKDFLAPLAAVLESEGVDLQTGALK